MIDSILGSFDVWINAQSVKSRGRINNIDNISLEGIARLRELILELAVQGKLVPQNSTEESGSFLLRRIEKQKLDLVNKGELKKEKLIESIEEQPFLIPTGWKWTNFQNISIHIQRGKSPKYASAGNTLVISQKCIQWNGFDISSARFIDQDSVSLYEAERFIRQNDLLWNSTGTGTVGRVSVVNGEFENQMVADSHVTVIRPLIVDSQFLKVYLSSASIQHRMQPDVKGALVMGSTNQVELNRSSIIKLPIPIPPLPEQKRIVTKVNELMSLCDELENQQTKNLFTHQALVKTLLEMLTNAADADELQASWIKVSEHFDTLFCTVDSVNQLKATILQLAVMGKLTKQNENDEPASLLIESICQERAKKIKEGKLGKQKEFPVLTSDDAPYDAPNGWVWCRLGSVTDIIAGASFQSGDFNSTGGIKCIKITNAGVGEFVETDDYLPETFGEKYDKFFVRAGDLVLALTRPYISGGLKISVCPLTYDNSLLNQRVAAIRSISSQLSQLYVFAFIQSPLVLSYYKNMFDDKSQQPNMKMSDITDLPFAVPPVEEQKRILSKINELFDQCDGLVKKILLSDVIKSKLSHAIVDVAK